MQWENHLKRTSGIDKGITGVSTGTMPSLMRQKMKWQYKASTSKATNMPQVLLKWPEKHDLDNCIMAQKETIELWLSQIATKDLCKQQEI